MRTGDGPLSVCEEHALASLWADPFNVFTHQLLEGSHLDALACAGMRIYLRLQALEQGQAAGDGPENEDAKDRLGFAQVEVASDFPALHARSVLSLWAGLETLVEDVAVLLLQYRPESRESGNFAAVKGNLVDFWNLSNRQRAEVVLRELQKRTRGPGVGQFDSVLEALGVKVQITQDVRRTLLALQQTRNLLAHRGGVVDARFQDVCPWLSPGIGERLTVSGEQVRAYDLASMEYVAALRVRIAAGFRPSTPETASSRAHGKDFAAEQAPAP